MINVITLFERIIIHPVNESIIKHKPVDRGAISFYYKILFSVDRLDTYKIKEEWEREMSAQITGETWGECLCNASRCSINVRDILIQFKVIHRLHYTKSRLHKMFPAVSPICGKCKIYEGTLLHSLWSCPKIQPFWEKIFDFLSGASDINLKPDPLIRILGATLNETDKFQSQAVLFIMILAKKSILMMWKEESAPTFEMWFRELSSVLHLEELRYHLNKKPELFTKNWNPIKTFMTSNV